MVDWRSGYIVEDEAYLRNDPALPFLQWSDERNQSMFEQPGTAYVYAHSISVRINASREQEKAVLIRAIEPIQNVTPDNGPRKAVYCSWDYPRQSMTGRSFVDSKDLQISSGWGVCKVRALEFPRELVYPGR